MLSTFAAVKCHIRFNPSKPSIDNIAFKLHYRATFLLLLVFTILVCSREYFGDHITCIADQGVPPHVIQTFCFFTSTFTLIRHYNETLLQNHILPHPGVGPLHDTDERRYHAYYQWVPFVLFGQALMFYATRYIWKKKEGGRMKALVDGLQLARISLNGDHDINTSNGQHVMSQKSLYQKLEAIKKDIILRLRVTRSWSNTLVTCEIANFINVLLQIIFTNRFLNGHFFGLGVSLFGVDWNKELDPLDTVFPKVTKCEFHKYGPSGSIQRHDALCVMALNVINEKIFSILWFWYFFLLLVSFLAVVWRLVTFIYRKSPQFNAYLFMNSSPGKIDPWNVITVSSGCHFSDWLFLHYLASNMDGFVFRELLNRLADELQKLEVPYETEDYKDEAVLIKKTPEEAEEGFDSLKRELKSKDT